MSDPRTRIAEALRVVDAMRVEIQEASARAHQHLDRLRAVAIDLRADLEGGAGMDYEDGDGLRSRRRR